MQIEISKAAQDYLSKKEKLFIGKRRMPRIVLAAQSCRGAEFRLWYDYPRPDDAQLQCQNYTFLVDPAVLEKYGGFKLDIQSFFLSTRVLIEPFNDVKECTCNK